MCPAKSKGVNMIGSMIFLIVSFVVLVAVGVYNPGKSIFDR